MASREKVSVTVNTTIMADNIHEIEDLEVGKGIGYKNIGGRST